MTTARRRQRNGRRRNPPGNTTAVGLGAEHQATRAALLAIHTDGDPCPYGRACLYWPDTGMFVSQGLDAGHSRPRALGGTKADRLEHAKCNRSHGARLGNLIRRSGRSSAPRRRPGFVSRW
jgi:hypothetical protein